MPEEVAYGGNLDTGEPLLAIALKFSSGEMNFFLTLGKPFHRRRLDEMAKWIFERSNNFALDGDPQEAEVCYSLLDASQEPYFFEAVVSLGDVIKQVKTKKDWERIKRECDKGHHLYFLGSHKSRLLDRKNYWSMKNFQ